MDLAVTGLAQCHKVISCVSATLRQRLEVVDFLGGDKPSFFPAMLAQWMGLDIAVTDSFPGTSVTAAGSRVTVVAFITLCLLLCVFLAEPSVSKVGTAGMGTRSFWLSWHLVHLLRNSSPSLYLMMYQACSR